MDAQAPSTCSVCAKKFEVRFRYQMREDSGAFHYFCSQFCQQESIRGATQQGGAHDPSRGSRLCACAICNKRFAFEYPWQAVVTDRSVRHFCSLECRGAENSGDSRVSRITALSAPPAKTQSATGVSPPRRIAVFNHKGGTGKTTTAINLAAGLAEGGQKVLLVDADGQGNVGAALGIRGEQSLYHVLVHGVSPEKAAVPVRNNLDVLTSNEMLAAAELQLATRPNRDRILKERMGESMGGYDVVVIDCAPALSLMNQNALMYADGVVVPVSCDYLSLVGVKQVLRTLKGVREHLKHEVALLGVLPTFFDVRNKISRDAVTALTEHFGERCLPPIRVNTKLREAPTVRQTIFEFAPDSHGALDYLVLVDFIRKLRGERANLGVETPMAASELSTATNGSWASAALAS